MAERKRCDRTKPEESLIGLGDSLGDGRPLSTNQSAEHLTISPHLRWLQAFSISSTYHERRSHSPGTQKTSLHIPREAWSKEHIIFDQEPLIANRLSFDRLLTC